MQTSLVGFHGMFRNSEGLIGLGKYPLVTSQWLGPLENSMPICHPVITFHPRHSEPHYSCCS